MNFAQNNPTFFGGINGYMISNNVSAMVQFVSYFAMNSLDPPITDPTGAPKPCKINHRTFYLYVAETDISWENWVNTMASDVLGAVSIRKTVLPGMVIPMLKIRRPNGRLIFNMEIAIRR